MFRLRWLLVATAALCTPCFAQENLTEHTLKAATDSKAIDADLSQFKWLQGEWEGTGFGGKCLESWSPAAAGSMMGTFRHIEKDKLNFCEVFLLTKTENGIFLKLKHFDSKLVGWEEKDKCVDFPLLKVDNQTAWFGGLTYQLQKDGSLKAWVAMKGNDGTFQESEIHYFNILKR